MEVQAGLQELIFRWLNDLFTGLCWAITTHQSISFVLKSFQFKTVFYNTSKCQPLWLFLENVFFRVGTFTLQPPLWWRDILFPAMSFINWSWVLGGLIKRVIGSIMINLTPDLKKTWDLLLVFCSVSIIYIILNKSNLTLTQQEASVTRWHVEIWNKQTTQLFTYK